MINWMVEGEGVACPIDDMEKKLTVYVLAFRGDGVREGKTRAKGRN